MTEQTKPMADEFDYSATRCSCCQKDTPHIRIGVVRDPPLNKIIAGFAILECDICHHQWYYDEHSDPFHYKRVMKGSKEKK